MGEVALIKDGQPVIDPEFVKEAGEGQLPGSCREAAGASWAAAGQLCPSPAPRLGGWASRTPADCCERLALVIRLHMRR